MDWGEPVPDWEGLRWIEMDWDELRWNKMDWDYEGFTRIEID